MSPLRLFLCLLFFLIAALAMGAAGARAQPPPNVQAELVSQAQKSDLPSVAQLVASGGQLNFPGNDGGLTPFHIACSRASWRKNTEWLKEMLALGANPNVADEAGRSPVMHLVLSISDGTPHWYHSRVAECVTLLIAAGGNANTPTKDGRTPLTHCMKEKAIPVVDALLQGGANPSAPGLDGRTPLELAVSADNVELTRILLDHGVKHEDCVFEGKRSLVEYVVFFGRCALFDLLQSKGLIAVNKPTASGDLLLYLSSDEMTSRLIDAGADVRMKDRRGRTGLQGRPMYSLLALTALIAAGADVNNQDNDGVTVLHQVCGRNVNVMFTLRDGSEQVPFVKALLDAGADPTIRAKNGKLPIDMARDIRNQPVIRLLESLKAPERLV